MKKLFILLAAMAFMSSKEASPMSFTDANRGRKTISVVNESGYKLLLSVVERQNDGSLVTYRRTLEPKEPKKENPYDYFQGFRDKVVGLSIARYGQIYGMGAKPKIITEADLLQAPQNDIILRIDYSATQQLSKRALGMIGVTAQGGTSVKTLFGNYEYSIYKFPKFSPTFGWLTAGTDWFTNSVDYFPGARSYSRAIQRVPAYRILGVPQQFTDEDVNNAYIALMGKWNPSNLDRFQDKNQKIFAWRMIELIDQAYEEITGKNGHYLLQVPVKKPDLPEVQKPIVYTFLPLAQEPKEELPELDDAALNKAAAETARKLADLFKAK